VRPSSAVSSLLSFRRLSSFARLYFRFFFTAPATSESSTLSLHDALPISRYPSTGIAWASTTTSGYSSSKSSIICWTTPARKSSRSEEHTSELQSRFDLVCRLLLEKKYTTCLNFTSLFLYWFTSLSFLALY